MGKVIIEQGELVENRRGKSMKFPFDTLELEGERDSFFAPGWSSHDLSAYVHYANRTRKPREFRCANEVRGEVKGCRVKRVR